MLTVRIVISMLVAMMALAQSDDIRDRLRGISGEAAATALANRDFEEVKQMLAGLRPASKAQRSEVLALQGAVEFLDGKMYAAANDYREASEYGLLKDADNFTFAMALVNLGDEAQARLLLTDLAERHPAQSIYVYWLGRLDYSQRRYVEAVEKLTRASELDPRSARIWDSLGLAFDMQGHMDRALEAFRKAVEFNRALAQPSPWPPHDLGFLLLRMDQLNEAESLLREALRYSPHLAEARYHLGRVLEKQGRDTEAIEEYRSAIGADVKSVDPCYSLAMLYRRLHRDTDAAAMFAEFRKRKQATLETSTTRP